MSKYLAYGLAAAAVLVVAVFIGYAAFGGSNNSAGPPATPTPTPTPEPTPIGWLSGSIAPGRHEVAVEGKTFSFAVPLTGWRTSAFDGMIEKGANPRWIAFFNPFEQVSTDPCTGAAQTVGPTVDDFANAMTTIPGTDAVGPTDTTVGGLPAKLVVLTFHDDIGCSPNQFWLYGQDSAYPNRLSSVMSAWIVEVNGTRYVFQTLYDSSDATAEQEVTQIIDSIQFNQG